MAQGGNMAEVKEERGCGTRGEHACGTRGEHVCGTRGGHACGVRREHSCSMVAPLWYGSTYITFLSLTCNSDAYLSHHF